MACHSETGHELAWHGSARHPARLMPWDAHAAGTTLRPPPHASAPARLLLPPAGLALPSLSRSAIPTACGLLGAIIM